MEIALTDIGTNEFVPMDIKAKNNPVYTV